MADLHGAVVRKATTFIRVWRQEGLRRAVRTGATSARNSTVFWSGRLLGQPLPDRSTPVAPSVRVDEPLPHARLASVRISVVMTAGDVAPSHLRASFRSVFAQAHEDWELCACEEGVGGALEQVMAEYRGSDPRLKVLPAGCAHGPAQATNLAAEQASGDLLVFLRAGDELHPEALEQFASASCTDPWADLLYADEDLIQRDGSCAEPDFKPDWSPAYLESMMYMGRGFAVRKTLFWRLGGMRSAFDGAQDYDLVLRASRVARRVAHVSRVLYHRRPGDHDGSAEDGALPDLSAAGAALAEFAAGLRPAARTEDGLVPGTFRLRRALEPAPEVTLVVLTADPVVDVDGRGRVRLLSNMLDSIAVRTSFAGARMLVVDDGELSPQSAAALAAVGGSRLSFVDPLRPALGFSFARKANFAVRQVTTDYLILLNDDLEVISPGWIEALLEPLMDPGVAAVGARLLYPDGTVQHAGIVLGVRGGAAHCFRGLPCDTVGYGCSTHVIREFSAVTGAVLAMRRRTFDELGGFDEVFAHDYQDVDFCARAGAAGYRVVYTPFAEFVHFEGKSFVRSGGGFQQEETLFGRRWPNLILNDPCYNSNLPRDRHDYQP